MGAKKPKKSGTLKKVAKAGKKILGGSSSKGKSTGRRKETVIGLQNKILKFKLKRKLNKLRYGGRI